MTNKILVEVSARHVHLDPESLKVLFGQNFQLTVKKNLSQPGQFLSHQKVDIVNQNAVIKNVSILGPLRDKTQVELSKTDDRKLLTNAPIRESGDLKGTSGCKIVGPEGEVIISEGVIIAKRHIHLSLDYAEKFNVTNGQIVSVKIDSEERALVFGDVVVRVNQNFSPAMHIDTDEANAANIISSVQGQIII